MVGEFDLKRLYVLHEKKTNTENKEKNKRTTKETIGTIEKRTPKNFLFWLRVKYQKQFLHNVPFYMIAFNSVILFSCNYHGPNQSRNI